MQRIPISNLYAIILLLVLPAAVALASGQNDHMMMDVESEYDFILEMIPHHQEAVDSSQEVIKRTSRKELADFADNIVRAQQAEIAQMKQWLSSWYPDSSGKAGYQPMMRSTSRLSADKADQAFLEDMIMHHQMAVMMAETLLSGNLTERPELKSLARGIISSQNSEITQMETWLKEWFGVSAPPPMKH